jgi:hypothetical protein
MTGSVAMTIAWALHQRADHEWQVEMLRGVPVEKLGCYHHPRRGRRGSVLRDRYNARAATYDAWMRARAEWMETL